MIQIHGVFLTPVAPAFPLFYAKCLGCGCTVRSDAAYADLDGPAFKAYYCLSCAENLNERI